MPYSSDIYVLPDDMNQTINILSECYVNLKSKGQILNKHYTKKSQDFTWLGIQSKETLKRQKYT